MRELEIVLALAVSMLAFSTGVSALVEVVHRAFTLRKHGMKEIIETFFEREVLGRLSGTVPPGLGSDPAAMADYRGRFLFQMWSGLRSKPPANDDYATVSRKTLPGGIPRPELDGSVDTLDVAEFFRRFAGTEVGRAIGGKATAEIDALVDDLATRFDDYGRQVSLYFKRRSQVLSVLVAVTFAVFFNVNVVTLVRAFNSSEALTSQVVSQTDRAMAAFEAHLRTREAAPAQGRGGNDLDSLKAEVEGIRERIDDARQLGLPVGWTDDEPFNARDINGFLTSVTEIDTAAIDFLGASFLAWLVTTIATGMLIGLGGPFWYDVVSRLSVVRQLPSTPPATPEGDKDDGRARAGETRDESLKATAREAFRTAVRAAAVTASSSAPRPEIWKGPRALHL